MRFQMTDVNDNLKIQTRGILMDRWAMNINSMLYIPMYI